MTTTELQEAPAEAPSHWPPVAHIVKKGDEGREGKRALCGAKMLGIDLEGTEVSKVCDKCRRILESRA